MLVELNNEELKVVINTKGAEIQSVKKDGTEYMWKADPKFWGRHAPVLFPIVGKLKDDQYEFEGKTYAMKQHGFARDREFDFEKKDDTHVSFTLKSDEQTRKNYPFEFLLTINYALNSDKLTVQYVVENKDTKKMYFSIGAHPGFSVPLDETKEFDDYTVEFSPVQNRGVIPVSKEVLLKLADRKEENFGEVNLSHALFEDGVKIYETKGNTKVTLGAKGSKKKVILSYDDMPYTGMWTPYPGKSPFVCIEPWCGLADKVDASGKLTEKFAGNELDVSKTFVREYTIEYK